MPQFIKMGLGGTGYLGVKELAKRKIRMAAKRRKVEAGYPIMTKFQSIVDVRKYLSGDKIICLLCGKNYRRIGTHLTAIHQMTPDEYRERYRIPYGYGLICAESSFLYAENAKINCLGNNSDPELLVNAQRMRKRSCPFKVEVALINIEKAMSAPRPPKKVSTRTKRGRPNFTK